MNISIKNDMKGMYFCGRGEECIIIYSWEV